MTDGAKLIGQRQMHDIKMTSTCGNMDQNKGMFNADKWKALLGVTRILVVPTWLSGSD